MKKCLMPVSLLLVLIGAAIQARAQNCDCNITPYRPDPPCFSSCAVGILALVDLRELVNIIRIPESMARRIVEWPGRYTARSFEEYREILTRDQYAALAARLNSLTEQELQLLRKREDFSTTTQLADDRLLRNTGGGSKAKSQIREVTYLYTQESEGKWRWKVRDVDGRVMALSATPYKTEAECLADIERLRNSKNAVVRRE